MGRDFFLSYSSGDYKPDRKDNLSRFFQDLEEKLKEFGRDEGGYFAAKNNESGVDWKEELEWHLRSCHVLVPLYSPNYFKSPHCGREWKVYYDRFQENKKAPPTDVLKPEVILPVLWNADLLSPPAKVMEIQDKTIADYPREYQESGLSYLMRSSARKARYEDFVHKFGRRLAQMLHAQGLPKERPIPKYHEIDPIFPAGSKRGLTFVRYVFLAGLSHEMNSHRPNWNGYGIFSNRQDWKLCLPERESEAGKLADALGTAAGKSCEFIEPGALLMERLRLAKALENIVIIVVDPWSLAVPALKRLASDVENEPLPNSALVVMWNKEPAGLPLLEPRFAIRESRTEYIVTVQSHGEFEQTLRTFFNTFRGAMMASGKIKSAEEGGSEAQPILKG